MNRIHMKKDPGITMINLTGRWLRRVAISWVVIAAIPVVATAQTTEPVDPLVAGFEHPPVEARPQTWWHWMNGNVTREGIKADLEAMHEIGIGEANIITVASGIPAGPVPVMSPAFFDMVEYAAIEAKRLGMTLCMANCPGWSSSGGPWVKPEKAMQCVTTSTTTVTGPLAFDGKLPMPPTKNNYYGDIAVFAFPTPIGDANVITSGNKPAVSCNVPEIDVSALAMPGDRKTIKLPLPSAAKPVYVQFDFPKPVAARTITIHASKIASISGTILTSSDGQSFQVLVPFAGRRSSAAPVVVSLGNQSVSASHFRIQINAAETGSENILLNRVEFSEQAVVPKIAAKAVYSAGGVSSTDVANDEKVSVAPDLIIHRDAMVDLTSSLKADGTLNWKVPQGDWTIMRLGYTCTGKTNHPAPPEATGLECDKLAPEGLDASWNGMMKPILDRLGPLGGSVLGSSLIDSYETGGQNWTPRMKQEFIQRRGYDPTPFLPVLTGRIIDSPAITERFLWDWRRTISDLFADNYFGHFTELCHQAGMKALVEPYTGPFASLQSGARTDVPMGEFWAGTNGEPSVRLASSIGHIYGQKIIGAESFTGRPDHGNWTDDPYSLKPLGDLMFCEGINRFVFHRYAHQPWMNRYPGMTMGQWGINLDRTNTWFMLAKGWMTYLSRCAFLLQQGRSVNDVAYFDGQSVPVVMRKGKPAMPPGYDYDAVNTEVLLKSKVVNNRVVLTTGASYAVLVLPPDDPNIGPQLLRKIAELVQAGAVVMGVPPQHAPGLTDYPRCDQVVDGLKQQLWGNWDGTNVTEHSYGQGRIIWGPTLQKVLNDIGIPPDFEPIDEPAGNNLHYTHRTLPDGDLYFVASRSDTSMTIRCTFRIAGKVPELWNPGTGEIKDAPSYEVKQGRTIVSLNFDPAGSTFVVFRRSCRTADHAVKPTQQLVADCPSIQLDGPWKLDFPPNWGAPGSVTLDRLISWADSSDAGVKYFSGTAQYLKTFDLPADYVASGEQLILLELGAVKNLAQVTVNGKDLGVLWKPPFRLDITRAVRSGPNQLVVSVTNLWPNRMIGDAQLPPDVKWNGMQLAEWPAWMLEGKPSPTGRLTFTTWQHITKEMPLLKSGLIGPVTIESKKLIKIN